MTQIGPAWWRPLAWAPWAIALEPVEPRHASMVARALTDEIARWLRIGSASEMRAGTPVWAHESPDLGRTRQAFRYLVRRDGAFAGVVELRPDAVQGHIGYWLRPSARGKGTMTMANHVLLLVAFEGLGLKAVDWTADVRNSPSIAVMTRLGGSEIDRVPIVDPLSREPREEGDGRRAGSAHATGPGPRSEQIRIRVTRRRFVPVAGGPGSLRELLRRD